jgi:glucoamylase
LNDTGAADFYAKQASKIDHRLDDFWDDENQHYRASLPSSPTSDDTTQFGDFAPRERTGLDCAIPLAILHAGDTTGEWSAGDEKVLRTVWAYVQSFEGMYAINKGKNWTEGWAVGRYKEDVYNGIGIGQGNPW